LTGAAIAGAATTLVAGGALDAANATATVDVIKAGAKGNGKDDNHALLQTAFDKLGESQVVSFPPGRYHLSAPLVLSANRTVLLGYGAIFDNTIILRGKELRVLGLSVMESPNEGFRITRGQGGHFEALTAQQNGGAGILIGGNDNSQVAWANFAGCVAIQNKSHGWHLDARNKRSWINANTFTGCWSRGNGGSGWFSEGKVNYNSWFGPEVENNCHSTPDAPPIWLNGNENFIYGGHVKDTLFKGVAVRFRPGSHSMIFGGRFIGTVEGADFVQAHVVSSVLRGLLKRGANLKK
jgi:polygalacturonase